MLASGTNPARPTGFRSAILPPIRLLVEVGGPGSGATSTRFSAPYRDPDYVRNGMIVLVGQRRREVRSPPWKFYEGDGSREEFRAEVNALRQRSCEMAALVQLTKRARRNANMAKAASQGGRDRTRMKNKFNGR